ncbi:MAG: hypothetical protein JWN41_1259 [Thermoleophilia bacterium]|nr:hypothetical protein [Thermoleophilia bacterium]
MTFRELIEVVGKAIDGAGVLIILLGFLGAVVVYLVRGARRRDGIAAYTSFRQTVGRAILLGLEVLVAADIIRTVAVAPTFRSVGVLAVIVLIRTFLSATLELELSGRWPWQHASARASGDVTVEQH